MAIVQEVYLQNVQVFEVTREVIATYRYTFTDDSDPNSEAVFTTKSRIFKSGDDVSAEHELVQALAATAWA